MEVEAREGQSVFLRGWGDYQRYSLKLTEADRAGLGHMALRAWSPEALERRVRAIEASGRGEGWIDGDHGHGPAYRFTDPDGHPFELYFETEKYQPARGAATGAEEPAAALRRPRRRGEAARSRQPARARRQGEPNLRGGPARLSPVRAHPARRRRRGGRVAEPQHRRPRAHLRGRRSRHAGAAAPPRLLGRHARGGAAGGRPVPRERRADRGGAVEARGRPGVLPVRLRARRQPHRGDPRRLPRVRPRSQAHRPWTEADRAKGQAWGVKTVESFHTYGTPPVAPAPH